MEEGIVGGRVGTKDTLRGLAVSQAGTDGGPLCGFNDFFTTVKTSFICPNADIMRSEMKDFNSEALRRDLARARPHVAQNASWKRKTSFHSGTMLSSVMRRAVCVRRRTLSRDSSPSSSGGRESVSP